MTHSVRRHLRLDIAEYDESIRRFIPGYESMLDVAAKAVAGVARPRSSWTWVPGPAHLLASSSPAARSVGWS